jgi:thiol:disulfide interchange protein DsbD
MFTYTSRASRFAAVLLLALGLAGMASTAAAGATGVLGRSDSPAVVENAQIRAELIAHAPLGFGSDKPLWLGLQLRHATGWHTYWKNPGDSGLPTELNWTLPPGWQAGPIQWPLPQRVQIGNLANYGYENEVLLPVAVTVPQPLPAGTDLNIQLHASWLVCREECIPQEGDFVLRLPLRSSYAMHAASFTAALGAVPSSPDSKSAVKLQARVDSQGVLLRAQDLPVAWQGKALNAFPQTARVFATASSPMQSDAVRTGGEPEPGTQVWQGASWSARLPLSAQRMDAVDDLPVVLARDGAGLVVATLVQGDWPAVGSADAAGTVSPALAAALAANAAAPAQVTAPFTSLAVALAAALLGGLILNLMPCVLPVLAIKALGIANQKHRTGMAAHLPGLAYTAGVMLSVLALGAALLALRAGGEQLGWGFQMQSPVVVAGLALLFTLIALNLMGWLEFGQVLPGSWAAVQLRHPAADAFFSGVLAVAVASPCSAPFMGASLGLALTLPATQALGIFAALGLGLALPFALVSSMPQLAAWLPRPGPWMLRLRQVMAIPIAATVLWLLWVLWHMAGVDAAKALPTEPVQAHSSSGAVTWSAWSPQAVAAEVQAGRPVFVDFTAAWCITCQYNKQTVLSDPQVLSAFAAKNVTLMRADWTLRDPAISVALGQLGRSGVPVYVLYRKDQAPVVLSEVLTVAEVQQLLSSW